MLSDGNVVGCGVVPESPTSSVISTLTSRVGDSPDLGDVRLMVFSVAMVGSEVVSSLEKASLLLSESMSSSLMFRISTILSLSVVVEVVIVVVLRVVIECPAEHECLWGLTSRGGITPVK